jgi:hypothetical protein
VAKKNIPGSPFSGDDGSADPRLTAALEAWSADRSAEPRVLDALRGARLLVPVVAVLGDTETDEETGLRREKTSDMAVPTLKAQGRTALPAFTSTDALARWDPAARPVAVPLHQALEAAAHEHADTLVLDLAGPVPYELTGTALRTLAAGGAPGTGDPLADPAVRDAVRAAVAAHPAVRAAHLGPGSADGTLAVVLDPAAGEPAPALRGLAQALAADVTLRERLVHGLDLAVLPAGTTLPGEPLYVRAGES